jgi:hypothetical protein
MNRSARNLAFLLFFLIPLLAASDDQQKAHKLLNKVTAMAVDPAGKRAISLAMSQHLSVARAELTECRRTMNLNYGDLFVVYQLVKRGAKMDDIAVKMKTGKTVWQAADEEHGDWKQIASEAKKLGSKVDTNLLRHFGNQKAETERDKSDRYNPILDTVKADNDVSQQEIEDAQQRYIFLRDHAGVVSDSTLDTSTEKSARMVRTDPIRTGGPSGTGAVNPPTK